MANIRPFAFDHIELGKAQLQADDMTSCEDFLIRKVDQLIAALPPAKHKDLKLPLVRLKIEHSNFPVIKSKRINDYFCQRVANP